MTQTVDSAVPPAPLPVPVHVDHVGQVAVITLNNAAARNSLSTEVLRGLVDALDTVRTRDVRGLVVTGAGKSFCAGGDLSEVNAALAGDTDRELSAMVDLLHTAVRSLRSFPAPTVTAVDGVAVGAGVSLALATDLRVVGRGASFVTGYLAVGASPDGGASFHLARALGGRQALASFVRNRRFDADELHRLGLADELVPAGEAREAAIVMADKLGAVSVDALLAVRDLIDAAPTHDLDAHLDLEKARFRLMWHTKAFRSAVAAFG